MSVLWVLIGFSILVAGSFLFLFIWAVRNGQYDDRYTPSVRILFEDEKKKSKINSNVINNEEGTIDNGNANNQVQ